MRIKQTRLTAACYRVTLDGVTIGEMQRMGDASPTAEYWTFSPNQRGADLNLFSDYWIPGMHESRATVKTWIDQTLNGENNTCETCDHFKPTTENMCQHPKVLRHFQGYRGKPTTRAAMWRESLCGINRKLHSKQVLEGAGEPK